jgi:Zn-dependent peptidase ImmA (M78 family)
MKVRRKYIEKLVEEILASNEIDSAPVNLTKIAKSFELEVVKQNADDSISGMLIDTGIGRPLIGINRKHHINRQRFTLGHEIGHFLLHKFDGVHFDGENTGLQVNFRDGKSSTGLDIYEREANLFAAELLMPRKLIRSDLSKVRDISLIDKDDRTLKNLAGKYKVSVRAITYRLAYLGYLGI